MSPDREPELAWHLILKQFIHSTFQLHLSWAKLLHTCTTWLLVETVLHNPYNFLFQNQKRYISVRLMEKTNCLDSSVFMFTLF